MIPMAYIRGVLDGDAWADERGKQTTLIGLGTVSETFTKKFGNCLAEIGLIPRYREKDDHLTYKGQDRISHMFLVTALCTKEVAQKITMYPLNTAEERLDYLIGFFQAEGSSSKIRRSRNRHDSRGYIWHSNEERWTWKITNGVISRLELAQTILKEMAIKSTIRHYPPHVPFLDVQKKTDIRKLENLGLVKLPKGSIT